MPSPTIFIPSPNGIRLKTSKTYCEENMIIIPSLDTSRTGSGSFRLGAADPTVAPLTPAQNTVGFSEIKFTIDTNAIKAGYIVKGHTILGIAGTAIEGIAPTGKYTLTDFHEHDITQYATVQIENPENFVSGNIRAGVTLLGVTGNPNVINTTLTTGIPSSRYIAEGYAAFVNGQRIDGTMAQYNGPTSIDLTTSAPFTFETSGKYVENDLTVTPILDNSKVTSPVILGANALSNITPTVDTLGLSGVNFQIDSTVLNAGNIRKGVIILGIEGTYDFNLQDKIVTPSATIQQITPDTGYSGLHQVTVRAIPSEWMQVSDELAITQTGSTSTSNVTTRHAYASVYIDPTNIISDNIKSGVTILGVSGSSTVLDTAGATALNQYILKDYTAYAEGSALTGTIETYGSTSATITSQNQVLSLNGYYFGNDLTIVSDIRELSVTSNGTYTPDGFLGYSNVIVDVLCQNKELTVTPSTTTQTFTNPGEGYNGYLPVTVSAADVRPLIATENKTYTPEDYLGYSSVTVEVPVANKELTITPTITEQIFDNPGEGYSGYLPITINAAAISVAQTVTPTKATQTINPSDDDIGISQVIVNPIPDNYQDVSDANATAADIRQLKTAYTSAGKLTGTIPDYDGSLVTNALSSITVLLQDTTIFILPEDNMTCVELYDNKSYLGYVDSTNTWHGGTE